MAVILSASDETYKDKFVYAGLLAPVKYWENIFAPRWEQTVLRGVPNIPFLHMTEIRSRSWRVEIGISEAEAEQRVDNAVQILCKRKEPTWVGIEFTHKTFNDNLKQPMLLPTGARKEYVADYLGFSGYVRAVIKFVKITYPGATKVDFLVEENGEVTKNLHHFYGKYEPFMKDHIEMFGDIIPGGKDKTPLQAADLLCWHLRRHREKTLEGVDLERYQRLARKYYRIGSLEDDSFTKPRTKLNSATI